MRADVALRTLAAQRRSLPTWAFGFAALIALYSAIWPSFGNNASYAHLVDQMPEAMKRMISASGNVDMSSATGYMTAEFVSVLGPLLLTIYAITAGAAAVAGEEAAGTLELILAKAVSRTRFALEKLAALAVCVAVLMAVSWLALIAGGTAAGMHLSAMGITATVIALGLLGSEMGVVAFAVGAATGRPGTARTIAALIAVAAYLLNGLGPLVTWLEGARKVSPFYAYLGHDPLKNGLSFGFAGVLIATTIVIAAAGLTIFRRRDLRA